MENNLALRRPPDFVIATPILNILNILPEFSRKQMAYQFVLFGKQERF
jgi:hypothetical protein